MTKYIRVIAGILATGLVSIAPAGAGTITDTLGEQDYIDGASPILSADFYSAGFGEVAPFDGSFFGSDVSDTLGAISFTHNFSLAGTTPSNASITFGLFDHDSYEINQDTIDIFFDGVIQDDSVWLGISAIPSGISVRSMNVDTGLLLDGALTVSIVATKRGQVTGGIDDSFWKGNGIGVDYSTLKIEDQTGPSAIPLPATLPLLIGALGLIGLVGHRRT